MSLSGSLCLEGGAWKVVPGSPAYKGGARRGDVLLAVNGNRADSMSHQDVTAALRAAGKTVELTVGEATAPPAVEAVMKTPAPVLARATEPAGT